MKMMTLLSDMFKFEVLEEHQVEMSSRQSGI